MRPLNLEFKKDMAFSSGEQREMLAELHRLAAAREEAERQTLSDFDVANVRARRELSDARQAAIRQFQMDRDATQREYDATVARLNDEYAAAHTAAERQLESVLEGSESQFQSGQREINNQHTEHVWEANTVFEATQGGPILQLQQDEAQIAMIGDSLQQLQDEANGMLSASRLGHLQSDVLPQVEASPFASENPNSRLNRRLQEAANYLHDLKTLLLPRLLMGATPLGIGLFVWVVTCGLTYVLLGKYVSSWLIVGSVAALVMLVGVGIWVFAAASAVAAKPYRSLQAAIAEARELRRLALDQARHRAAAESWRITQRRDADLRAAQLRLESRTAEITARRDSTIASARDQFNQTEGMLVPKRDSAIAEAHRTYPQRLEDIQQKYQAELRQAQEKFDVAIAAANRTRDETWGALTAAWKEGTGKIRAAIEESRQLDRTLFAAWDDPRWNTWAPSETAPPTLRFGQVQIDLNTVPGAISAVPELNGLVPAKFDLPALLPFPQTASVLWQASGLGRQRAVDSATALMLRMLTVIPPGKVRFTIIDPVGLGENFAAFMHLADHDEQLVNSRIWTEPQQIEHRLADMTEQMENVIQKYLRNEFRSIDEYNAFAGEVAEPFRVLVVANFPVNFTEAAARRLVSIATSGARCGVFTLVIHDVNQPLPPHFDISELQRCATTLEWDGEGFKWRDPDYETHPLTLDEPPSEELFTRLLQAVGRRAKESKRVEVPFDFVAPEREKWWTGDTAEGIRVPLGRAGATKRQFLRLGEGTAQHVLVAGKTGSGKSSLLHALITNAALTYSPDQLELYLVDFKKGVEFKTYATYQLPHARVIAIESEREFGLSVLEKLDGELRHRGELYREVGAQDVAAYRRAAGPTSLPRILLIIDEFQEFFTEDDKLAQDAALLLDRLVRQGRAFGIHVLLGSQTLGGAYSLARSTIGQMAVRIALQCSEADAHLILSEENSAARLLSRPGEAIYNDANGLVQGNNPFQIVWLSEHRREQSLQGVQHLADEHFSDRDRTAPPRPAPPIVFEGNLPADLECCRPLAELLRAPDWPVQSTPVHAWLGEAIAIKDPTAAVLRPQGGANLLIVGQREAGAMGMLASALVSIAAQHRPATGRGAKSSGYAAGSAASFYILEHERSADSPLGKPLADFRSGLSAFATVLPHPLQAASRRDLPAMISEVAAEVARRQTDDKKGYPALYLFICDLGRFRDLRRDDADIGFSSYGSEKEATPAQLLNQIVRDGPAVGVYTIAWCDSLTAVNRAFDRHVLREFALRVLMQMSANDSSYLIDSPIASKLGAHGGIFQNEEEGRLEKFRPYAWPNPEWLATVQERFQSRVAENV